MKSLLDRKLSIFLLKSLICRTIINCQYGTYMYMYVHVYIVHVLYQFVIIILAFLEQYIVSALNRERCMIVL